MAFTVRGYGRASTDKQVLSTKQQESVVFENFNARRRFLPKWSEAVWGGFFADEDTTRTSHFTKRENGSLLLAACQPGDVVMVSNYDRIFANVVDVCDTLQSTQQRGWHLIVLDMDIDTTTILGAGVFKILACIKEMEVMEIRRRTKASAKYRKENGLPRNDKKPIGWKVIAVRTANGKRCFYVPCEESRLLAKALLRLQVEQGLKPYHVGEAANKAGIRDPRGNQWCSRTAVRWLRAATAGFPVNDVCHNAAPVPPDAVPIASISMPEDD